MNIEWVVERCNEVLFRKDEGHDKIGALTTQELDQSLSEAARHGMLPVVMESLTKIKVTDLNKKKVLIKWYGASEQSKKKYWKRLALMELLALQFKAAGLDVMFMKGATNALWYPAPQLRVFSDIDYYLYGDFVKGAMVLEKVGVNAAGYSHHHTQAHINGVLLENHYDFLDRENHQSDLLLDDELKRLAAKEGRRYPFRFDNSEANNAYCMSPTMNAIFLMRHMGIHFFSETVALRMLYDWALFLKQFSSEVDWDKVLQLYKESGMLEFTQRILGILTSKLGLEMSECPMLPLLGRTTDKIWNSIIILPPENPYKENEFRHHLFEGWLFLKNRWKFQLVFANESYWKLLIKFSKGHLNKVIKG